MAPHRSSDTVAWRLRRHRPPKISPSPSKNSFSEPDRPDPQGLRQPRNLTLVPPGQGDGRNGASAIWADGLVGPGYRRPLGPGAQSCRVAVSDHKAYSLPQGVIAHLFRDIAAAKARYPDPGRPGHLSSPASAAASSTPARPADIVRLLPVDGEEYLFYKAFPIPRQDHPRHHRRPRQQHLMEKALTLEAQAIAMAAKNSGGIVIALGLSVARRGTLNARR